MFTFKKKIWAIYSASEKGWWNKSLEKWVFSLNYATKYSVDEKNEINYPLRTKHIDAQWICTDFSQAE